MFPNRNNNNPNPFVDLLVLINFGINIFNAISNKKQEEEIKTLLNEVYKCVSKKGESE